VPREATSLIGAKVRERAMNVVVSFAGPFGLVEQRDLRREKRYSVAREECIRHREADAIVATENPRVARAFANTRCKSV
jgi:hypothetical protein